MAAMAAVSPIDEILRVQADLQTDLRRMQGASVVLRPTGSPVVDREICKLADGSNVVWKGEAFAATVPTNVSRAVFPVSRIAGTDHGIHDWWLQRLSEKRRQVAALEGGEVDLVMLGDSITHLWEAHGKESCADLRKTYSVLNLGYKGDRTCHLLWRIRHGELDGYRAKAITLMIGTNNAGFTPAEETAAAIREILSVIREKQPQATVFLMPIFPRGPRPDNGGRLVNDAVNGLIFGCADGERVIWLNVGSRFLDKNGDVVRYMPTDRLHLNAEGYRIWLEALYRELPAVCGGEREIAPGKRRSLDGKTVWWEAKRFVPVEGRADGASGRCLRFSTDAKSLKLRWSLTDGKLDLPYMPASGASGIDVYEWKEKETAWRFKDIAYPRKRIYNERTVGVCPNVPLMMYLPLVNGLELLEIGLGTNETVRPLPLRTNGIKNPIVFCGPSAILQGAASRPGMSLPALVSRWLDAPAVSFVCEASGEESALLERVSAVKAYAYVVFGSDSLVRALKARCPDVPVVGGGHPCEPEGFVDGERLNDWGAMRAAKAIVAKLSDE